MNEQQFLDILESHLQKINEQERADIRRDFEEYFENGRAEGKTTEEIIHSFGDMDELAKELLASYDEEDFVQAVVLEKKDIDVPYRKVKVKANIVNLSIVATDADEAMIETNNKDQAIETSLTIENDTLVVKVAQEEKVRRFWFITIVGSVDKVNAILHLPKKHYEKLVVENQNGSIKVSDINAAQFDLQSDNGRVMTNAIQGDNLYAHSDNGRIILENSAVQRVKASSNNGRVVVENCRGQQFKLDSSNGRVQLKDIDAQVEAYSSNGRIEAQFAQVSHPVSLKTENGRIELSTLRKLENVLIEGTTSWGSTTMYNVQTSRYEHGTKEHKVHLKTSNGKIIVEEVGAQ